MSDQGEQRRFFALSYTLFILIRATSPIYMRSSQRERPVVYIAEHIYSFHHQKSPEIVYIDEELCEKRRVNPGGIPLAAF